MQNPQEINKYVRNYEENIEDRIYFERKFQERISRKMKSRRRNSLEKLNIEMILRRSFCDSFKDYIHNCSLAGAKQLCDPNISLWGRIIWTIVLCTSFGTICYFLNYIWTDTLNKPLIVTLESTAYPIGNIAFPAVAICNVNRISKKALAKLASEEYNDLADKESLEEVQRVLLNLGRLMDYSYNDTLKKNKILHRLIEKYRFKSEKIIHIMKELTPSCEDTLLRCFWAGSVVDCSKIFTMRRTANRGYCCTFNYVLNYNLDTKPSAVHPEIKRQVGAGLLPGLTVVLDPLLDDYAYPLSNIQGFDVLIFDAMHFADPSAGRVSHRMTEPNNAVFLEVKSTKQIATKEIRKYSLKTRGCLFKDEIPSKFRGMYSYSACIVMCRILTIQSLCKCIPFFFAVNKIVMTTPVCTIEDLRCLNKYKEKLFYLYPFGSENTQGLETELQDSLSCPYCKPDCEITQYSTKSYESPLVSAYLEKNINDILLDGIEPTNKSSLSVYFPTNDATLVRLDVVSYWYEVLSNIGGFCGIIAGFSIISIVEIIYFFTIRYIQHFIKNYRKYR